MRPYGSFTQDFWLNFMRTSRVRVWDNPLGRSPPLVSVHDSMGRLVIVRVVGSTVSLGVRASLLGVQTPVAHRNNHRRRHEGRGVRTPPLPHVVCQPQSYMVRGSVGHASSTPSAHRRDSIGVRGSDIADEARSRTP